MKLLKPHPTGPEDLVSYWQPQYPIIVVTRETDLWEVAIKSACCLHRDRSRQSDVCPAPAWADSEWAGRTL